MGRFRLGSTSLQKIHHVEKSNNQRRAFTLSLVSWFSEQRKSKTPGWSVRQCSEDVSLGNECKNELQTHTQESLCDTYFKHGIGWHTTQYGKGYCQQYDDFQGNDGHFIGDWLNIVYFSNTPRKLSRFLNEQFLHARFIQLQFSVLFNLNFLHTAFQHHTLPGNGISRYRPVNCVRLSQQLQYMYGSVSQYNSYDVIMHYATVTGHSDGVHKEQGHPPRHVSGRLSSFCCLLTSQTHLHHTILIRTNQWQA